MGKYIKEFYDGAFEDRFSGKSCCLYKLPKNKFKCKTSYLEVVSETPVEVVDCLYIEDSAKFLLELEKRGKLKIYRYKNYNKNQKDEIDRVLRKSLKQYLGFKKMTAAKYAALSEHEKMSYDVRKQRHDFCYSKFPEIMKELENNQD